MFALITILAATFSAPAADDAVALKLGEPATRVALKMGDIDGLKMGDTDGLKLGDTDGLKLGDTDGLKLGDVDGLKLGTTA